MARLPLAYDHDHSLGKSDQTLYNQLYIAKQKICKCITIPNFTVNFVINSHDLNVFLYVYM